MRHVLNLHARIASFEPCNSNAGPNCPVIRHPLLKVSRHCCKCLADRCMIGIDAEDLLQALAASVFEAVVDILKGVVDLGINTEQRIARLSIPSF